MLYWILVSTLALMVSAANVTVDDAGQDIVYSGSWNIGNTCTVCVAQPQGNRTYQQTWHDVTRDAGEESRFLEYSFEGGSVTLYGILADIVRDGFTTNVNLTISIDGEAKGVYQHVPQPLNTYSYDVPMLSVSGLSAGSHTLRAELEPNSMWMFDYLVYTTVDSVSNSSAQATSIAQTTYRPATTIFNSETTQTETGNAYRRFWNLPLVATSAGALIMCLFSGF